MKWVKWAVTETKGCGSTSKSVTASCTWDFQPLRVGSKPPNKFKRISTECFLWNSEVIYMTCSTPSISGAKTERHSEVSFFKRIIFYHILKNIIKGFIRRSLILLAELKGSDIFITNIKISFFLLFLLMIYCHCFLSSQDSREENQPTRWNSFILTWLDMQF